MSYVLDAGVGLLGLSWFFGRRAAVAQASAVSASIAELRSQIDLVISQKVQVVLNGNSGGGATGVHDDHGLRSTAHLPCAVGRADDRGHRYLGGCDVCNQALASLTPVDAVEGSPNVD